MTLNIETINKIKRLYFVEHFSVNAIAKLLGIHYMTVKNHINNTTTVQVTGKRKRQNPLEPFDDVISQKLEEYPKIKCSRLWEILKDRGYAGSYKSLQLYTRDRRAKSKKAYMKLNKIPGEEGQVDWAHFKTIQIGAAMRKLFLFIMVLAWSRKIFARFTLDMKTDSFLSLHIKAFHFFQGVPRIILYDNLKSAVISRQGDLIQYNQNLLSFSGHYNYEIRACQPYSGNQKGRVERSIRYIRENFFEGREVTDLDKLNEELELWLVKSDERSWPDDNTKKVGDCWDAEKNTLIPLPDDDYLTETIEVVRSGKTPWIHYDLNKYSIPPKYVREPLGLHATFDEIRIYDKEHLIATHKRTWDRGLYVEDRRHTEELKALKGTTKKYRSKDELVREIPEVGEILRHLVDRGENLNPMLKKLHSIRSKYCPDLFKRAIEIALEKNCPHPSSIEHILNNLENEDKNNKPYIPISLPDKPDVRNLEIKSHPLEKYDNL